VPFPLIAFTQGFPQFSLKKVGKPWAYCGSSDAHVAGNNVLNSLFFSASGKIWDASLSFASGCGRVNPLMKFSVSGGIAHAYA